MKPDEKARVDLELEAARGRVETARQLLFEAGEPGKAVHLDVALRRISRFIAPAEPAPAERPTTARARFTKAELVERLVAHGLNAGSAEAIAGDVVDSLVDVLIDYFQLRQVATEELSHAREGLCPDAFEGYSTRDPACPACQVLMRGDG